MKIRVKFTKTGVVKFIGHLDLLRLFQKAFRRANTPMIYSQGFNPHQLISIAAPLSVGVTSDGEYMDIEISDSIDKNKAITDLNNTLPEGVRIIDWIQLEDDAKSGMAIVNAASYSVTFNILELDSINKSIIDFLNQEQIIITKKSKKNRIKELNIKEGIIKFNYNNEEQKINMMLATGSKLNVKPEFVIKSFYQFLDIEYKPYSFSVHRNDLYANKNNDYIPLNQL